MMAGYFVLLWRLLALLVGRSSCT